MKFSNLVLTSSISVVASSLSGNLRASDGAKRNLANCAATIADLDFPSYASEVNCKGKNMMPLVKIAMADKGCSTKNKEVKAQMMVMTGQPNANNAKKSLATTCKTYIGGSDDDNNGGGDDEDDNTGACTSIQSLNFRTIGKCETSKIQARVQEQMDAVGCSHNYNTEIQRLTDESETDKARSSLQQTCFGEFGCTTDFDVDGCDYNSVIAIIARKLGGSCPHNAETELQKMTGTSNLDDAKEYLSELCDDVFDSDVETTTYTDIDSRFTNDFMDTYVAGQGFLNTETGNFQGNNPDYPVSQPSKTAGESINTYYNGEGSTTSLINSGWGGFSNCQYNSYMCCFGRDRQSGDDNGNCANNDCADADPGDNSNLCFTEPSNTPYFGESEDDIHCHGLAWAEDENDLISRFSMNNFFYVSMYDHMYQRGYVEPAVAGGTGDNVAMCGCIEDMPKVSRSDCTQVDVDLTFSFHRSTAGFAEAETDDDPDVDFNACKGTDFDGGNNANNDLASYAVRLVDEGRMSTATRDGIFKTLLGYADPGDNENEDVCAAAYEELTGGGGNHPCTNVASLEVNGCDYNAFYDEIESTLPGSCPHGIDKELQLLTGAATNSGVVAAINAMCSDAWDSVDQSDFQSISNTFTDSFMKDYIKGDTFLNLETGNFQGNTDGSDQNSINAGEKIDEFHDGGAKSSRMASNFPSDATNFEDCALNSIMCCFGRDRQFGDDNGNCNKNDCDNADPGDNSNLCYTEPSNTPFPKDAEGDVHCHGLAWADDENDFSARLKYNNFFYVSLYDHMYSRGYVQEMTFDQDIPDTVPMCGCMEDMHPVSRSDCTELGVEQIFEFSTTSNGLKGAAKGAMEIEFNACKGIVPGNPGKNANNDLASHVNKLVAEGKLAPSTQDAIYQKLVGYENPGSNKNEDACKASYESKTGDTYPRK